MAKNAAAVPIRQREDGFWEVSGVAGYHKEEDARRVAGQVARALDEYGARGERYPFPPGAATFGADDADDAIRGDGTSTNAPASDDSTKPGG
jgi:hypothetical protein